jgi:tyrosinase
MNIRRNIYSLSPDGPEIAALRAGVAEMQSRDPADPTSWIYQANIHGSVDTPPDERAQRMWNQCQHRSFFFLSWHRMYLLYFERILRDAADDPNLALPYWDYANPAHRALPIAFREPADASNPLFVQQRNARINSGDLLFESLVQHRRAFGLVNFTASTSRLSFGGPTVPEPQQFGTGVGALENEPHNIVHGLVGGRGGLMSDPNTAARDPIFWLHHSNIDRLWGRWLDQGGGRQNPVNDDLWMDTLFTFFDPILGENTITGRDILDTLRQLDYRYDDDPPDLPPVPFPAEVAAADVELAAEERQPTLVGASEGIVMIELGAAPVTVPIEMQDENREEVAEVAAAEVVENRVVLSLEGIQFDRNPGVAYEVYINLPEGQEPDYRSEYFAGTLGFFGLEPDHVHGGGHGHEAEEHQQPSATVSYDVTPNVRALQARGEWREGPVSVTFVMRTVLPPPGDEEAAAVALAAEPAGRPRIERVTLNTE